MKDQKFVVFNDSGKEAINLDNILHIGFGSIPEQDETKITVIANVISKEGDQTLMNWLRAPFPLDTCVMREGKIAYICRRCMPRNYKWSCDSAKNLVIEIILKSEKIEEGSEGYERRFNIKRGIAAFHNQS